MSTHMVQPTLTTAQPQRGTRFGAWVGVWHLLTLLRSHYGVLAVTVLVGVAHQATLIATAGVSAYIVGAVATGATLAHITPWLWGLGTLVLGRAVAAWLDMWIVHDLAYRVIADIRAEVYWALERLAPAYLIERRSGDVASAAMGDVEILEWFYAHTVSATIVAFIVPTLALLALGWIHPLLPLVLLIPIALVATVPFWLGRQAAAQGRRVREQLGDMNADVVDGVQGLREITAFGQEQRYLERLGQGNQRLLRAQLIFGFRMGFEQGMTQLLLAVGMLVGLAMAAWLVAQGAMAAALFPVAVILAGNIFTPILAVTSTLGRIGNILAAANRVFAILHEPVPVTDKGKNTPVIPTTPDVRFEQVRFRYQPHLPDALQEVSFTVQPGETVALVGHSGAGKSTCAHLLLRFWDVVDGGVKVGGVDLRDFPQEALRQKIALVPQDIYLFNMSIRDNIRLAHPTASDADVERAAHAANAHEFITALPKGYDTNAGERGLQLSGGQRQRIAIARALLKDAPILVMDEAVSNLDTENERALQSAMTRLRKGRTTLIIAHRLSTIRSADRLVVLEKGRVAEIGTHDELVARQGVYARLIASQHAGMVGVDEAEGA